MGSGGPLGLQNRWSASLAMSTDGSFPSRPRHFSNTNLISAPTILVRPADTFQPLNMRSDSNLDSNQRMGRDCWG